MLEEYLKHEIKKSKLKNKFTNLRDNSVKSVGNSSLKIFLVSSETAKRILRI